MRNTVTWRKGLQGHSRSEADLLFTHDLCGPYVSGAGRVILVVGTQKIVRDLEEGLLRINEYAYRLEDARAQAAYGIPAR